MVGGGGAFCHVDPGNFSPRPHQQLQLITRHRSTPGSTIEYHEDPLVSDGIGISRFFIAILIVGADLTRSLLDQHRIVPQ